MGTGLIDLRYPFPVYDESGVFDKDTIERAIATAGDLIEVHKRPNIFKQVKEKLWPKKNW